MKSCKDCIHYEDCFQFGGWDIDNEIIQDASKCNNYTEKAIECGTCAFGGKTDRPYESCLSCNDFNNWKEG